MVVYVVRFLQKEILYHFVLCCSAFSLILFSVLSLAMDVLGKLCTLERNDGVIEAGLEPEAYQSLIKVLIVNDVQVV